MLSHNAKLIETILFIENEALTIEKLAAMSNISEKECEKAINELKKAYEKEGHGIYLKTNEDETFWPLRKTVKFYLLYYIPLL